RRTPDPTPTSRPCKLPPVPGRRHARDPGGAVRLDRLLASRGLGSRRGGGRLLARGRVRIGDEVVRDPRHEVDEDVEVDVDGVVSVPLPVVVRWHKPVGVLTTLRDPWGREGLEDALPPGWIEALRPIGRL